MKKKLLLILLFLLFPMMSVQATPPRLYYALSVIPEPEESLIYDEVSEKYLLEGHFDLLVKKSDFPSHVFLDEVSPLYQELFPEYLSHEYLNGDEWVSYLAYMKDASFTIDLEPLDRPMFVFGYMSGQYKTLKTIKLIYFNDLGETIAISDEVTIRHARFYEWEKDSSYLAYNIETNILTSYFDAHVNPFLIFFIFLAFFGSLILTLIKLFLSTLLRIDIKLVSRFMFISWISYGLFALGILYIYAGGETFIDLRGPLLLSSSFIFLLFGVYTFIEFIVLTMIYRKNSVIKRFLIQQIIIYEVIALILWLVLK